MTIRSALQIYGNNIVVDLDLFTIFSLIDVE